MGTAKVTFDKAIRRAEYLMKLAEGLTDRRKRGARSDWTRSFNKLMHWPQSNVIERVDSKDVVLVIRSGAQLSRNDFTADATVDLLRAALVMSVSAMDAYFHAKILRYVVSHSKNTNPSNKLLNEPILVRDFINANRKKRSYNALRAAIERNLSYQSLQHPEKISDKLGLIGISNFWEGVADKLGQEKSTLWNQIVKIAKRRNQITHEGDLSQSKKSRNKSRELSHKYVSSSIDLLKNVVEQAEEIINIKLRRR